MTNETLKQAVMQDIVLLSLVGIKVVLVHGGGPEINAMLKKINKQSEFVNGLRYTDEETIDIVQMVLAGKVNKDLVQLLQACRRQGRWVSAALTGISLRRSSSTPTSDLSAISLRSTRIP